MGALLGIMAASLPGTPVKRLVVNDAGPVLDPAAIARIGEYFGTDPTFATYDELATYVRTISAPFGPLTDAQWDHVTRTNARQRDDGRWSVGYDPAIAVPVSHGAGPGRSLAAVGRDPVPDARAARRDVRPALERHGARDERARARGPASSSSPVSVTRRCCLRRIRSILSSGSCVRPY